MADSPLGGQISSLWMQQALAHDPGAAAPALRGSVDADVCVVGGGYTGLWTALAIREREPSARVVVLEASVCGAGASGVNGGFALTLWSRFAALRATLGAPDALRVARASADAVAAIGRFCATHDIDAHFAPSGWLWAATNRAQLGSWAATVDELDRLGVNPFRELGPGEAAAMAGSERHLGGVFDAAAATVQPALLVRGLRRVALAQGIEIVEHSPMTSLAAVGDRTAVTSPGGRVVAGAVVLATNAALAGRRELRRHLVVLGSDIVATAPVPARLATSGWTPGLAISDSRRLVHYYRTTAEGRAVFGKGGGRIGFAGRVDAGFTGASPRGGQVAEQLFATYPQLRGTTVTHTWTGAVDYSIDGLPFVGSLRGHPRVHYAVGYSGNGVAPSWLVGQILASRVTGRDDEWAASPLVRRPGGFLPPEPVRWLGGQAVRRALARKEGAEDAGRRPDRVTALVAGLDPTHRH